MNRITTLCMLAITLRPACCALADDKPMPSLLLPAPVQLPSERKDIGGVMQNIADTMSGIATDLSSQQTGQPVQAKQTAVAGQLDTVIQALEQQCKSGGGSNMNPTKPMSRSTLAKGPGGIQDLHDPRAGEKQWGALKPKERDQILQSKTDGFPAGYESLLQSYYRRLSAEDNAAAPAAAQPTTSPSASQGPSQP